MDQRPIGVFDSGSGGLTAVREIRSILPFENIIYFGDTSRVPYGGRSAEILLRYARQDVHFLRSFDVKALLVACGTVSTNALPVLAAENDIPVLGVVKPSCAAAAAATRNKRVGLIATAASVRSGAYERCLAALDGAIQVYVKACPLFVPLVENGRFRPGDPVIETVARGVSGAAACHGDRHPHPGLHPLSAADGDHRGHHGPWRDAHRLRRCGGAGPAADVVRPGCAGPT